jgi:hypothetical protein
MGKLGQEVGLQWGGTFKSIKDYPHFQYTFGLNTMGPIERRSSTADAMGETSEQIRVIRYPRPNRTERMLTSCLVEGQRGRNPTYTSITERLWPITA